MSHKIMRLPEVIEVTGLSRSTIYIAHWLDARVAESKLCSHD